eukprot:6197192-Pleurochrysis_carterae.AAC.1
MLLQLTGQRKNIATASTTAGCKASCSGNKVEKEPANAECHTDVAYKASSVEPASALFANTTHARRACRQHPSTRRFAGTKTNTHKVARK